MAGFKAGAHLLDQGIGAILDALDASGLSGNTIVLYTTDHGPAFPLMKCNLTDHGIGVALILRVPGMVDRGVSDALVSHIDIFPTLCDLIGVPAPPWLEGRSLLPILTGEAEQVNDAIFAEVTYHAAYEPQRAVRTTRYKYIRRYGDRAIPVLPNCDDSPSKELLLRNGWAERPIAQEQLYDIVFDPNEAANLADRPEMSAVLAEMRERLDRWMRATGDPLLSGSVAAPSGALINDPAGLSPSETPIRVT
jgi:N-sulfoglucosamine sulfohydrolase